MALTFEYCRSCGGKTQIDLRVPAGDRRCVLCGLECSDPAEIELPEDKPEEQSVESGGHATGESHRPTELVEGNCPRCRAKIAINPDIPFAKQRCHACGLLMEKSPEKGRNRRRDRLTADGVLETRVRQRVWMPILGTTLAVVIVVIFGMWMANRRKPEAAVAGADIPADTREQIKKMVFGFTAAKTPEELLPFIRDAAAFRQPVLEWCRLHPGSLPLGGQLTNISYAHEVLGTHVASALVVFPARPEAYFLTVETTEGYRVDWRTFTGIADMSIEQFLAQKPQTPTLLMAIVRRSDYYNNAYSDRKVWMCLQATDGNGENAFFAYLPRARVALMPPIAALPPPGSRADLRPGAVSSRLALRMYFSKPGATDSLQAEIESVAGEGWYVP